MILAFNILTAAQTGNTILFAVSVARGDLITGLSSAISISAFLLGALASGWICRQGRPMLALAMEMGLLLAALTIWLPIQGHPESLTVNLLVTLAAAAMGIQSAVTINIHGQPGTYVTGLLTNFAVSVAGFSSKESDPPTTQGFVWLLYLFGAIVAGLLFVAVGPLALLVPIAALTAAIILFLRQ
jgi:uncharacterized membrane protein YoaK (UPF0700 family)